MVYSKQGAAQPYTGQAGEAYFICMCVYTCMYVCIGECMCAFCVHSRTCGSACILYVCACVCTLESLCAYTCMRVDANVQYARVHACVYYLSYCCDKILTEATEGGFLLAHTSPVQSTRNGDGRPVRQLVTSCLSRGRKLREANAGAQLTFSFLFSLRPSAAHTQGGLPTVINLI